MCSVLIADTVGGGDYAPDVVEMNRIKASVESVNSFENLYADFGYDFTVVNDNGDILFSTNDSVQMLLEQRLNNAIRNFDAVISFDGGYIVVYTGHLRGSNIPLRLSIVIIISVILVALTISFYIYIKVALYRPFKKLKDFASDIATGNLDTPLPMDKGNLFGEFTESFDIMREELKAARQKIIDEEKSKKELIATLSHDIKTPVAIVRAASELLEIGEKDKKKLANIKAIQEKSLEIDTLITDLFSSALEDLSELRINITDIESKHLQEIIIKADALNKVILSNNMPDCLIRGDALRLGQIFGNIISNSYKYANSEIHISFALEDKRLLMSFKDKGNTLQKEEVPLLTKKFYRGKNAEGRHGVGLGLYICLELIKKMGGELVAIQESDGFRIDIAFVLS